MGFPFAIVGFDLDGTLLDTLGDLAAAVNHTLALMERAPLAEAAVRPMIGRGARHMLEEGLRASGGVPDGAVERLYPARSEARRVGKEVVRKCRYWWSPTI